ncbi:hypothetical protein [Desulfobacula sp.]|uniref:hypothetical protein n=1 Tax=Desulfobacula sp. TaxID=2593537 RepID=UPI0026385D83|nr:hypothetical protein [Desulfobacula sp.]
MSCTTNYSTLIFTVSRSETVRDAEKQTEDIANHISSLIVEHQKTVKALARHNEISNHLIKKDSHTLSKANSILDLFHQSFDLDVCYLMDRSGEVVATSNRNDPKSFAGKNYSFRQYFLDSVNGSASVYMALVWNRKGRG